MQFTIRPLNYNEFGAYRVLRLRGLEQHPEAFGETPEHFKRVTSEEFLARLLSSEQRGSFILVASDSEGSLVGTIGLAISDAEKMRHRGTIWGMYVSPEMRRVGLGRRLIEECLARASAISTLELVNLAVVTTNSAAVSLYESFEFKTYGTDPAVLKIGDRRFDEFLMVKYLRDVPAGNENT